MKLTVLVDNNTLIDNYYKGEPALSFYIEENNKKYLFDVGYFDLFLKNAKSMNIDLKNIDGLIISHGHDDHTRGLKYYLKLIENKNINLYSHPLVFNKKIEKELEIGSIYSKEYLNDYFKLKLSKKVINITDKLIYLGEIPNLVDFEKREIIGKIKIENKYEDDYLLDDSALVYKSNKGLFIITGCSHSGICNIIEYAKKVCNDGRVYGVIGGFHLFKKNERLKKTIEYFKKNNVKKICPLHCTSLIAKCEFINAFKEVEEVGVGFEIEI